MKSAREALACIKGHLSLGTKPTNAEIDQLEAWLEPVAKAEAEAEAAAEAETKAKTKGKKADV